MVYIKTTSLRLKVNVQITLGSTIKTEMLVSEESPYFSHYLCKISGQSDVAFRTYEGKSSESLEIVYTQFLGNFKSQFKVILTTFSIKSSKCNIPLD